MSPWLTGLVTIASVLLGGGGLVSIVNAVIGRRGRRAEVADRLSDSTLKWVEQFQEEAAAARHEATEARREVAEIRTELRAVRSEAEALAYELRRLRLAIMAPDATVERLRAMVGPNGVNGAR